MPDSSHLAPRALAQMPRMHGGAAGLALLLLAAPAAALDNKGVFDTVTDHFAAQAASWQSAMMNAATWLFWTLGTISLAWTAGMMVLRKADLGEFFAEFARFIVFFGFFLWLLRNGPAFARAILDSMRQLGAQASGLSSITPSSIVDLGFLIWEKAVSNMSVWKPMQSLVGILLSGGILLLLAIIAVNMLLLTVSGWILMYAGIFFLGFGGSRWTSDMAINYYKSVLGVGAQLLAMVLLVGIGNQLLQEFYSRLGAGHNLNELVVMLVFCLALLMLTTRIPALVAGMVSGAGGAGDLGSFGSAAVRGATLGAASMVGAAFGSKASNTAKGDDSVQALVAALSQLAPADPGAAGRATDTGGSGAAAGASGGDAELVFPEIDYGDDERRGSGDSDSSGTDKGDGGESEMAFPEIDYGDDGIGRDSDSSSADGLDGDEGELVFPEIDYGDDAAVVSAEAGGRRSHVSGHHPGAGNSPSGNVADGSLGTGTCAGRSGEGASSAAGAADMQGGELASVAAQGEGARPRGSSATRDGAGPSPQQPAPDVPGNPGATTHTHVATRANRPARGRALDEKQRAEEVRAFVERI